MTKSNIKTVQTYLGDSGSELLDVLCKSLMLSKSAVIRLALRKLYTSSEDDIVVNATKRLAT
ncbi:MAG: hypothetical protein IT416_01975 [Candidatus Pacebacteria bacterium]|nr:hypothetical protein [Candidatus Paceibacterota bacterium]